MEFTYEEGWDVQCLSPEDQLLLSLMKIRNDFAFIDLAFRFGVSERTARVVFSTLLKVLHVGLFEGIMMKHVPSLEKCQTSAPACLKDFPTCRFIIDCTEIHCNPPRKGMDVKNIVYSHYKGSTTFKALIAVAPNGTITFVSPLYGGSTSDKAITKHSGFLEILKPGDLILADKGFRIQDIMPTGVTVNVPPFLYSEQFTVAEAKVTTAIARARIHVERAIQRIKCFRILDEFICYERKNASNIFQVCAALANLQGPLLKETENL